MSTNKSALYKAANWQILPDISILCQYLSRNDLIELSETCKRIRKQFNSEILKKLNLSTYGSKFSIRERINSSNFDEILNSLLNLLEEDLKNKLHLVKEIAIHWPFNDQYASRIVSLFPSIAKFQFSGGFSYWSKIGLLTILNGMRHLEHVELSFHGYVKPSFSSKDIPFSKSLKSIKIYNLEVTSELQSILDSIDSSYTNLTSLSITSNKMLQNLSIKMPNLKEVIILNNPSFDNSLILEFLKKNPQLAKLEIFFNQYTTELINAILSSKNLKYLVIQECIDLEIESFDNYHVNDSIEKIELGPGSIAGLASLLINNCQNAKTIELREFVIVESDLFSLKVLNQRISTLKFDFCSFYRAASCIQALDSLKNFNRATFIECNSIDDYYDYYEGDADSFISEDIFSNLSNYELIPDTNTCFQSYYAIKKL
ncbi:hypothetical protein CONCODRAFT_79093 [Conidiobolus coronatus NRRL 28638]|uniref:F-box domain-containing protein n=1 Tax=Conidiobolus coronatus (strain ATCC 28846 / CBS 209.66 / NRRL 28638) TaxID=796925 RepID=A0A137P4G5_CONC2|nr:hypothetical protein CONCODRAFT_79093 [Conidiobolus coronatus NRRL 28638]|eukprot:KXN69912.1 hypothetical protein CONCODRAFT_79093 [Conidiobolus coronatus NRRL 28638]